MYPFTPDLDTQLLIYRSLEGGGGGGLDAQCAVRQNHSTLVHENTVQGRRVAPLLCYCRSRSTGVKNP